MKRTTQTLHATRANVRVALFRPDINVRSVLLSTHALTYTSHVRSSGSQVCVGNRNHRAKPVLVLRRAPMNPSSDCSPTHTNHPAGRTASRDPTRVPTGGESSHGKGGPSHVDMVKWHTNTWRKTKPTTPLGVESPSDPYEIAVAIVAQASGTGDCWARGDLKNSWKLITAENENVMASVRSKKSVRLRSIRD